MGCTTLGPLCHLPFLRPSRLHNKHQVHISCLILCIQKLCGCIIIKKLNSPWKRLQQGWRKNLNPIWSQKLSLPWNETNNFDFPKGISSGRCMAHSNYPHSPKLRDRWPAAYLFSSWPSSQVFWHFPLLPTLMWLKTKANCIKASGSWVALHVLRTTGFSYSSNCVQHATNTLLGNVPAPNRSVLWNMSAELCQSTATLSILCILEIQMFMPPNLTNLSHTLPG